MRYLLLILMIPLLTSCSLKGITKREYRNFTIIDKPKQLKLTIKSDKKKIKHIISLLKDLQVDSKNRELKNEIKRELIELYGNDTKLLAITEMKIKIKVLEKIIEQYEKDIVNYYKWLDR